MPFSTITQTPDQEQTHDLVSYSVGLRVRLVSELYFKANAGHYFRLPTFTELFGQAGTIVGNPNLIPEEGNNFDAGFTYTLPEPLSVKKKDVLTQFRFEYAFFLSEVDDIIILVQNSQRTSMPRNLLSADIMGHEISWSSIFFNHFDLSGNYTVLDAIDTSGISFLDGNQLPGRPTEELYLYAALFVEHGRIFYEFNFIGNNFVDRANFILIDERLIHNAGITWTPPKVPGLSITAEAKNISDNQISDFAGFPLPGISYFGTVNYQL